jgi:hypothetical protein
MVTIAPGIKGRPRVEPKHREVCVPRQDQHEIKGGWARQPPVPDRQGRYTPSGYDTRAAPRTPAGRGPACPAGCQLNLQPDRQEAWAGKLS